MYFECSSGTGKGNNLIVTCASDFAGVTITCTNGVKTYSRVCPSSEPYEIEFSGLESGTWTISGTVEGTLYSTNAVIADYTATLDSGFDYKTWCTEGGVDASQYSSLADVFADELATRKLMTVHASADYLIDAVTDDINTIDDFCANDTAMKWIGLRDYVCDGLTAINGVEAKFLASQYWERYLKDHVPTMTSNTAPYGEASADSTYSSDYPWKAFDGTELVEWNSNINNTSGGQRLIFKFPTPINVRHFRRMNGGTTSNTFKIGYSDDGLTWTDLNTEYVAVGNKAITEEDIENVGYHLYWSAVQISSLATSRFSTIQLQFYGRSLNVSVPVMTSNTAPYGEAIESSNEYLNAFKAFDNNDSTFVANSNNNTEWYCGYKFNTKVKLKKLVLKTRASYGSGNINKLQYSDDGATWNDDSLVDLTTMTASSTQYVFDVSEESAHNRYRIDCPSNDLVGSNGFISIQFYGLDYSEREFEEGTTRKWLYDHGLELEAITTSGTVTKSSNYLTLSAANSEATATVDLTNYSLLRGKVGDNMSGTTQLSVGGSNPATATLTTNYAPNNFSLGTSLFDQSLATGVKMTANGVCDITELWLGQ